MSTLAYLSTLSFLILPRLLSVQAGSRIHNKLKWTNFAVLGTRKVKVDSFDGAWYMNTMLSLSWQCLSYWQDEASFIHHYCIGQTIACIDGNLSRPSSSFYVDAVYSRQMFAKICFSCVHPVRHRPWHSELIPMMGMFKCGSGLLSFADAYMTYHCWDIFRWTILYKQFWTAC